VGLAGVKKDALGQRGLAGVDVRHDADISRPGDGKFSGHRNPSINIKVSDGVESLEKPNTRLNAWYSFQQCYM